MNHNRMIVAGVPRSGKTTFTTDCAARLRIENIRHSDDLIAQLAWSDLSAHVMTWFDEPGPWIIEGVATVRTLRKWLKAHPEGTPADVVYYLPTARVTLTEGQQRMAKACDTIWEQVFPHLLKRRVEIRNSLPAPTPQV